VVLTDGLRFAGEFAMLLRGVKEGAGPGSPGEREGWIMRGKQLGRGTAARLLRPAASTRPTNSAQSR